VEELLPVEEHARNEKLFVELEHNQIFWFIGVEQVRGYFKKLMTILLLWIILNLNK
jgi:hypothetical protein